jgi:hypothetical protein
LVAGQGNPQFGDGTVEDRPHFPRPLRGSIDLDYVARLLLLNSWVRADVRACKPYFDDIPMNYFADIAD